MPVWDPARFTSDWERFGRLIDEAEASTPARALGCYRQALSLMGGRPFPDAPVAYFSWAEDKPLVSDFEIAVSAVAGELGALAMGAGKPELASWAARQGLRMAPGSEDRYRLAMQAEFDGGEVDS